MKLLIALLAFAAVLVVGCNSPQKASENIKAETVATEIVDSVAMELENAKAGIDDAAQELDNAIKELN
jgi:predicted small secreted protein